MNESFEKVIVALDYENPDLAFRLIENLGNTISWYKVGPVLFTRSGTEVLRYLHKANKRVFVDLKLHDTPIVVGQTVRQLAEMGVHFATIHCMGGAEMLNAAAQACRGSHLQLLGITLLTSQENGPELPAEMNRMVDLASECRLSGIVCSPHEIANVRKRTLPGFLTVTPGIRLKNEEVFQDDQKRVATPREAIEWGADYLVVGRPITLAREPKEIVNRLFR